MRPNSPIVLLPIALGERRVVGDILAAIQLAAGDSMLLGLAYLHETNYQPSKIQKSCFANQQSNKQLHSYSISLLLARDNYAFISVNECILKIPTHGTSTK